MECAAEARLAFLQRAPRPDVLGHVLERDRHATVGERECLDREHAGRDALVAVLNLAGVVQRAALDDVAEAFDRLFGKRGKDVAHRLSDDRLDVDSRRLDTRGVRVVEAKFSVLLERPHPQRRLHVPDDVSLRLQPLDQFLPRLELGRVAHHRADELRHEAGGLDGQLIERVGCATEDREHALDGAVAIERRADQRAGAQDAAGLRVDARVGERVG